jgi:hypothetical protein
MAKTGAFVPIVLDRQRHLLFDDRALSLARDQFGIEIVKIPTLKPRPHNLCVLLYCGLSHEPDAPSVGQLKKLVTAEQAAEGSGLWVAVAKALVLGRGRSFTGETHG